MWIDTKYITLISNQLEQFKKKNSAWNFRCPYCGDSKKDKFKARGYLYPKKDTHVYFCHNCGVSKQFSKFLQDQNAQLYQEYSLEKMKEVGNLKDSKRIDTFKPEVKEAFPSYLRSGQPLRDLKKISQLDWDHSAKKYILSRKIPNYYHSKLFHCPNFLSWTNRLIPNKFKDIDKDEPRLIIPFIDENNKLFGYQGRSYKKDASLRYITIMLDESRSKIFGLDVIDFERTVYVTEGPLDSCFVDNCIAMAGSDGQTDYEDVVMIYDNEPRSIEIVKKMQKAIDKGKKIVIWPKNIEQKDINDMIMSGMNKADIKLIIEQNTYNGLQADMALVNWKRV